MNYSKGIIKKYALVVQIVVVFALFQILTGGLFFRLRNVSNILFQGSVYAIIGIGYVFVLSSRHMDLAAGSVLGFLSTAGAVINIQLNASPWLAMIVMIISGMLIGMWHGYWIAYRYLPAFVVTLTGQLIFRGLVLVIGGGRGIGPVDRTFSALGASFIPTINESFNDTSVILMVIALGAVIFMMLKQRKGRMSHGLSVPSSGMMTLRVIMAGILIVGFSLLFIFYRGFPTVFVILLILACIFSFVATSTRYGRYVYAIGGNIDAARMSGVNVKRTIMKIYVLHGFLVAIASILYLGRTGMAIAGAGMGFEFSAITGAVVGGVSTLGGTGTVFGAIMGTFLVAGIDNGMSLLNLGTSWQYLVRGGILLFAIAFDVYSKQSETNKP